MRITEEVHLSTIMDEKSNKKRLRGRQKLEEKFEEEEGETSYQARNFWNYTHGLCSRSFIVVFPKILSFLKRFQFSFIFTILHF